MATKKFPTKKKTTTSGRSKATPKKKAGSASTGKSGKTTSKASPKKKVASSKKKTTQDKTTQDKSTQKKAASKKAAPQKSTKKATGKKVLVIDENTPTEDLWALYQKVRKQGTKGQERIEEIRNELMERHLPLVRYIADRLLQTLPKSIELDDLVSAGLFGLMDAIRGFDPERGIKFKTYCSTRIRGSILDQLRSQDWVPRLVRLKASKIEKALQRLTGEYGREPTHTELAEALEMDHGELSKEIREARAKAMFSLSEKWEDHDDDSATEKLDILEDQNACDPFRELNRADLLTFITRSLTHKERFIIEQYYKVGHTMREIGEMLALTESRVCQIHSNVMGRLKGLLGQKQGTLLM